VSIATILDLLRCPRDGEPLDLSQDVRAVACSSGHRFDLARHGYLNLSSAAQPRNADTAQMVGARARFLASGTYATVEQAVLGLIRTLAPETLLDCGAGTGHLLARLLDACPSARGLALDVSVPAARRAARAHARLGVVVADAWRRLPLHARCVDVVISNFAPRNEPEFARVLTPRGGLLTVTPTEDHLRELRERYGLLRVLDDKSARLEHSLRPDFHRQDVRRVEFRQPWGAQLVRDAIAMGPNAFHGPAPEILSRPVEVTVSVEISLWTRRP
jgi:23S rRNA (guanine745-N1)-methyltransferase